jgi:RimJ/RimL family protein N-acetyltransferase
LLPDPEIGWFIDREYWGKGLASEGASAALEVTFDEFGFERILAICKVENVASSRVIEKIGMSYVELQAHPRFGFALKIYEVGRL